MCPQATNQAKFARPALSQVVPRARLFDRLREHGRSSFLWIAAPAGFGKTTLVASYLEAQEVPSVWFRLDGGDGDPNSFFLTLEQAVRLVFPDAPACVGPRFEQPLSSLSRNFFSHLSLVCAPQTYLVFDNAHELEDSHEFWEMLSTGLACAGPALRVVFMSRSSPPDPFVTLLASDRLRELPAEELRLNREEVVEMVRRDPPQAGIGSALIPNLLAACNGWAACLRLVLRHLRFAPLSAQWVDLDRPPPELVTYFSTELFQAIDPDLRCFLLNLAVFPWFDADMATRLTGVAEAASILERMAGESFFTSVHRSAPDAPSIYIFHSLFRNFLRVEARKIFSSEQWQDLFQRAGRLLEEAGDAEAAINAYSAAGDTEAWVATALRHAPSLLASGRHKNLERWLAPLPAQCQKRWPWTVFWLAGSRFPESIAQSRDLYAQALDLFQDQGDHRGMLLAWAGRMACLIHGQAPRPAVVSALELFDTDLTTFYSLEKDEWTRAVVAAAVFLAKVLCAPEPETIRWGETALGFAERLQAKDLLIHVCFGAVLYFLPRGENERLAGLITQVRFQCSVPALPALPAATLLATDMLGRMTQAREEEALALATQGLQLVRQSGVTLFEAFFLGYSAACAMNTGDLEAAERFLDSMAKASLATRRWDRSLYCFLSARLSLLRGAYADAERWVRQVLDREEDEGPLGTLCLSLVGAAQIAFCLGWREQAEERLAQAGVLARQYQFTLAEWAAAMAQAYWALAEGDRDSCRAVLKPALALGRRNMLYVTLVDVPAQLAEVCVAALEEGMEVPYVQRLVRQRRLLPSRPPLHVQNWPWRYRIFTLGVFAVQRNEREMRFGGKAPQQTLNVLKALIACGREQVPCHLLSDLLWEEAPGDAAHNALKTQVHRLRRLLGDPKVLTWQGKRLSLDPSLVWVDVGALSSIFERFGSGELALAPTDVVRLVLDLYKGPFLPEIEESWVFEPRRRFAALFSRVVTALGRRLEETGQWMEALFLYSQAQEREANGGRWDKRIEYVRGKLNGGAL
ncbi:hypothetical protein [Desulfohalobium retbaense]|uniref:Tetratricopeptide TPR_4 n=1 Tax=Desulfohalobium retbaense (strain ATCC 49708 / DSM 5692 / JCM 16813 / HR100) TaxID=485915 RepID=C8X3C0_DESRD|nr:hypothetical protein [Desulfohalobium retbaense]ACV68917.1 tetratricopeptide TPR_4 [Desulfohalobium retbaense DSM 5692]